MVLLVEKKNKERGLVAHNIKRGGKALELGEEFSSYDKVKIMEKNLRKQGTSRCPNALSMK